MRIARFTHNDVPQYAFVQTDKNDGKDYLVALNGYPLSGQAVERIRTSEIDQVVVTDTIPTSPEAAACPNIRVVSIAGLLAETLRRINNEESVSYLFME